MVDRKYRSGFLDHPAAAETHNQTVDLLNTLEQIETRLDAWLRHISQDRLSGIDRRLAKICRLLEQMAEHQGVATDSTDQGRDPESSDANQHL